MSIVLPYLTSLPTQADTREAVGERFSAAAMRDARDRSMAAVRRIAALVQPGMTEADAIEAGEGVLRKMEAERSWHPVIVRFGEGTLKTFRQRSDPSKRLQRDDIFFIDIGPVWGGHEADAGDTFVVGDDAAMLACAEAARAIWQAVADHWRSTGSSGQDLYRLAAECAEARGWRLNLDIRGHRVSDYPHAVHRGGDLGDLERHPVDGLWILEIQIAHPARPFGAFFEDLLTDGG